MLLIPEKRLLKLIETYDELFPQDTNKIERIT